MSLPGTRLFRERALQGDGVRESLDEHVRVVHVPRWVALAVALLVVGGLIAWAAYSSVETTVSGTGALEAPAALDIVDAPAAGTVLSAPPPAGSVVRAGQTLATIETTGNGQTVVEALVSGTIQSALVAVGDMVVPGQDIATVTRAEGDTELVAFLFVPLDQVGSVEPGMEVLLSPGGIAGEEGSLLEGRVRRVDRFPAEPSRIAEVAGSGVANELASGPVLAEVDIELVQDPSTPTGYAWTTGEGPVEPLAAGTVLTGDIVTATQSPLDFAF